MHIASFAGFAPVNNPVIAVAVVLDSPKGQYYGTAISAPVFAEVAQQVLEYLGVPHDIDLRPADLASKKDAPVKEDDAPAQGENIQALYDAANDLPSDDPLRAPPATEAKTVTPAGPAPAQAANSAAPSENWRSKSALPQCALANLSRRHPNPLRHLHRDTVVIADAGQLRVPSLIGLPVREIIEQAGSAGLEVEITGDGIAREQAPAPGAMVPARHQNRCPLRTLTASRQPTSVGSNLQSNSRMNWNDLICRNRVRRLCRQLRRAHHRHRIRLAPRAARRGLRRHERRLDRRQSLRRQGHRRRRARHHHRLRADIRSSDRLSTRTCRSSTSSMAAARSPRHPPLSSAIPSASSPPPASPAPTAKPPLHSSPNRCSTPPRAPPFSSAPLNITSPARCGPRFTPRPSRAISSS